MGGIDVCTPPGTAIRTRCKRIIEDTHCVSLTSPSWWTVVLTLCGSVNTPWSPNQNIQFGQVIQHPVTSGYYYAWQYDRTSSDLGVTRKQDLHPPPGMGSVLLLLLYTMTAAQDSIPGKNNLNRYRLSLET